MKIKYKLRLGFGFLFVVVLFFGFTSLYFINRVSDSAKVILKDNYETLSYTREMRTILDQNSLPLAAQPALEFNKWLSKQEHNITERGEGAATELLKADFNQLQNPQQSAAALVSIERRVRTHLNTIELLNMQAIVRKNDKARSEVNEASIILGLTGTFGFLILFSFSVNFPDVIANPINSLLGGIREISEKNYSKRLHFADNDEFAEVASAFNDMAAKLHQWENSNLATVISDKRRIETIIEQMHDAIIGIDENQEILFANAAAENILNLKEKDLVGQKVDKFIAVNDLLKYIIDNAPSVKPFKIALDGKEAYFQLETREIAVPNLEPEDDAQTIKYATRSAGKVFILRNVTEFKERDDAKTNFIATISHELKTPISSVKLSLKLLADKRVGELNAEQKELVKHIQDDSDRLLKITSELLDLSQVETGNIQLNLTLCNPSAIVEYAISAVKFQAEQKNIQLEVIIPPRLPQVQVDIEKTAWVLVNFLSNALRYSAEKSKVSIKVNLKDGQVQFSVQDFGKGIDSQYQKRLFDRYFQVPTDAQNKSGSGLGLAISKNFIEAQQGTIGVESEIGEGSRFYFLLPAVNVSATQLENT